MKEVGLFLPLFFINTYMTTKNNIPVEFIETNSNKLDTVLSNPEYTGAFIHIHDEGDSDCDDMLYIGRDRVTDNLNTRGEELSTPTRKIGGLGESTIGDLKKKSISEIIIDMVKAERVEPTIKINPSVSLSYSGNKLIKVGTSLPTQDKFTVTANPGSWSDDTPYWGDYETTLSISPGEWGGVSEEGIYRVTATGTFAPGGSPKDNYGTVYESSQGGTKNASIDLTVVKPVFVNDGNDISTMVEHIVDYNIQIDLYVTIQPEEDDLIKKFMIQLPYTFTKFEVYQFNPVSNNYDSEITMIHIGDNLYTRTDKVTDCKGLSQYKITLKK